jgi:D-alanyl-D-alanine carboxypeptidase
MKGRVLCAVLLVPLLETRACSLPPNGHAGVTPSAPSARLTAPDDSVYAGILRDAVRGGVPGVQAYVRTGDHEWRAAMGFASVEKKRPLQLQDRIRVASITKMLTYATVMELEKEGRLRRDARVVTLLPPGRLAGIPLADEMTVAQLLDHTSGLYNFNGENGADFFRALLDDPARGTRLWTADELLAFARDSAHPPTGRPGQSRSYSSTGYIVLQIAMEYVTGQSFGDLYARYLFAPLGMTRSGVEGAGLVADSIVDSYAIEASDRGAYSPFKGRAPIRADGLTNVSSGLRYYNAWAGAAGAVATTVDDLASFMKAVISGKRIVLRDQEAEFARVATRPDGFLSWNGGSWGIQASIIYSPARDVTVIVLSNASDAGEDTQALAHKLLLAARH